MRWVCLGLCRYSNEVATMLDDLRSTKTMMVGALLLTAALAGCAGSDTGGSAGDGAGLQWSSFQEAMNAPGTTHEANNTDSPIKLKLLQPASESVSTGRLNVTFLLYDSEANQPVTTASFTENKDGCGPSHSFCAKMPGMGHGTSPEESPSHVKYGVYHGYTTISMNGHWRLNINPSVDGQVLEFDIDLSA